MCQTLVYLLQNDILYLFSSCSVQVKRFHGGMENTVATLFLLHCPSIPNLLQAQISLETQEMKKRRRRREKERRRKRRREKEESRGGETGGGQRRERREEMKKKRGKEEEDSVSNFLSLQNSFTNKILVCICYQSCYSSQTRDPQLHVYICTENR